MNFGIVLKIIESDRFKFFVLSAAMTTFFIYMYLPLREFLMNDELPKIDVVDVAALEKLQVRGFSVGVDTGMFIKNFSVFEPIENKFVMDAIIWFEFNVNTLTPETIEKFSFDNGKILYKSPADIKAKENRVFVKYNIRVSFKCHLKYPKFPFDDHRIFLLLSNDFTSAEELFFQVSQTSFNSSKDIRLPGWDIKQLNAEFGSMTLALDRSYGAKQATYPKVLFTIDIAKKGIRRVMIIFLPLLIAIFFAMFSFTLSPYNITGRSSTTATAVTAMLGYRFVIDRMSPNISYLNTTDKVHLILLVVALFCFIFQMIFTKAVADAKDKTDGSRERWELINDASFIIVVIILIISLGYGFLK